MNLGSDIWFAFARTFAMLFMVLALLLLAAYLLRRFSTARKGKGARDFIEVLAVHHFSPKEKLVLVNVLEKTLLIGVTPSQISNITTLEKSPDPMPVSKRSGSGFSDLLGQKLTQRFQGAKKAGADKDTGHDA